jgi:hypothetical protein
MGYKHYILMASCNMYSSFNSLYGIHKKEEEYLRRITIDFQFPLWDTALRRLAKRIRAINTFNSLYGIPARVIFRFIFGYSRGTFYLIINPLLDL